MYLNLGLILSTTSALAGMTSAAAIEAVNVESSLEVRAPEAEAEALSSSAAATAFPWAFKIYTAANCGGIPAGGYSKSGSGSMPTCGSPTFVDYYSVKITDTSAGQCTILFWQTYNDSSKFCTNIVAYTAPGKIPFNSCYTFPSNKRPIGYTVSCKKS